MSKIRIEVFPGTYDNDDVYNRVLGYIGQKTYLGGYGFFCGPGPTIIEQFQLSEYYSRFQNDQKIWHFVITFSESWKHQQILSIGRNASNTNRLVGRPDMVSAVIQAAAPGMAVTSIPKSRHMRTSSSPGSEIPGVPASVISAISFPSRSCSVSFRPLSYLLYS